MLLLTSNFQKTKFPRRVLYSFFNTGEWIRFWQARRKKMSPGFVSTDQIYNIIILVSHPLYSVRDFYIERIFEIWISLELTFTLLDFFITNLTRSGFKLIEFNSYEIEFGLELMKMLKLAPNTRQRKSRLISRPSLLILAYNNF